MIKDVTIPARLCTCEAKLKDGSPCNYSWISIAERVPVNCQNRACRSREWNGRKERKVPPKKPALVMPKPIKIKGGNEDDTF